MIGLLLPLLQNNVLSGGGGPPPPSPYEDAPPERYLSVESDDRTIAVEHAEDAMIVKKKDPSDVLDYTRDFGGVLDSDESISSAAWSLSPSSVLTVGTGAYAPTVSSDGKRCKVWLSSGTLGIAYTVTVNVTTNNSPARTYERSFIVEIEDQ